MPVSASAAGAGIAVSGRAHGDRQRRHRPVVGRGVEPIGAGQPGQPIQDRAQNEPGDEGGEHGAEQHAATDVDPPEAQHHFGHIGDAVAEGFQLRSPPGQVLHTFGGIADSVEQQVAGLGENQQEPDGERRPPETGERRESEHGEDAATSAFDATDDAADGGRGRHAGRREQAGGDEGDQRGSDGRGGHRAEAVTMGKQSERYRGDQLQGGGQWDHRTDRHQSDGDPAEDGAGGQLDRP